MDKLRGKWNTENLFSLVFDIVAQVVFLVPWIRLDGTLYNSIMYISHVIINGGSSQVLTKDIASLPLMDSSMGWHEAQPYAIMLIIQMGFLVLCQLMVLIHMILLIKKRQLTQALLAVSEVLGFASIYAYVQGPIMASASYYTEGYIFVPLFWIGIEILGVAMIGSYAENLETYKSAKAADAEFRKEKEERLKFEGRYSSMFFRVIWKNFRYNWNVYRIFVAVTTLSVTLIFSGMAMWESLKTLHAHENFTSGQGLSIILAGFIEVMILIAIFLIIMVLLFYLKNHVKNYGMFVTLGMRRRTLYIFMGIELASCFLISMLMGLAGGTFLMFFCRKLISSVLLDMTPGKITYLSYLLTAGVTLFISLISVLLTREVYIDTGASESSRKSIEREKYPGRLSKYGIVPGAIIAMGALLWYTRLDSFENVVFIGIFFLGFYLLLRNGLVVILNRRRKNSEKYNRGLLRYNHFYYRYQSTFRYIFFFTVIHFCALFLWGKGFISTTIAQDPQLQFPHDYVCMATENDEDIFSQIEKCNADVKMYPMVRITNPDNTTTYDNMMANVIPQGQNIGISQSTYKELCLDQGWDYSPLNLDPDGKNALVVFQQDQSTSAHPIDYSSYLWPMLHVGQPLQYCDYIKKDEIYSRRDVIRYITKPLIGPLRQGEHENLVVFSDEYMDKIMDSWKTTNCLNGEYISPADAEVDVSIHQGPSRLVLINIKSSANADDVKEIDRLLEIFDSNHSYDNMIDSSVLSIYDKRDLISERTAEHAMNRIVNGFIMCMLAIISIVLMRLKMAAEFDESSRRFDFLECMGVSRKDRVKLLRQEYDDFIKIPIAAATVITVVYTLIIWELRGYSPDDCLSYSRVFLIVYLIYMILQVSGMKILEHAYFRKIERR